MRPRKDEIKIQSDSKIMMRNDDSNYDAFTDQVM